MHETADRLVSEGRMEEIIIVGIATVPHQRLNEYFHDNPRMHEVTDPRLRVNNMKPLSLKK